MLDGLVKGFRSLFGGDDEEKRRQQQQNQTTQPKNTNQNLFGSNVSSQFNASGFNANSNSTADAQARADAERRRKEAEDERKRQEEAAKRKREAEETARKAEAAKKQAEALRKQRQQNVLGQNFVNGANQATTIKPVVNQELTRKAINEEATTKNLDTQAQKYGGINDQTSGREIDIRKRSNSLYEQNMKREESQASWLDKQFGREQMKKRAYDLARSQAIRDQARDLNYEDRDTTNILSQSVAMQRRRAQEEAKQAQEDLKLQNIPGNVAYHAANTGLGLVKGGTRAVTNFVPTTAEALTSGAANTVKFFDEDNEFANKVLENIKKDRENNQVRKYVDKYTKANNQDNQIANQIGEGLAGVAIDSALTLGTGGLVAPARHGINAHQGMMEDLDNIEQRKKAEAEAKGETYIPESFKQKYLAATGHALTQAAIEKMGIDALLNPLGGSLAGRALSGFLSEGAEEGAQQFAENAVKRGFDDKQNLMEGVGESALVGGITGGIGAGIYGGSEQEDNQVRISRLSPSQMKYNVAEAVGAVKGDTRKRMSNLAFRDLQNARQGNPYITNDGMDVELSKQGNRKYTSIGAKAANSDFVVKQRLTPKMNEAIAKSNLIDNSPDLKNHGVAPDGFDYREVPVRYRGQDYKATLDIAKNNKINRNTLYEGNIRKESPQSQLAVQQHALHRNYEGDSRASNIPQTTPEVNLDSEFLTPYGLKITKNDFNKHLKETIIDDNPEIAQKIEMAQTILNDENYIGSKIRPQDAQHLFGSTYREQIPLAYLDKNALPLDIQAQEAGFDDVEVYLENVLAPIEARKQITSLEAELRDLANNPEYRDVAKDMAENEVYERAMTEYGSVDMEARKNRHSLEQTANDNTRMFTAKDIEVARKMGIPERDIEAEIDRRVAANDRLLKQDMSDYLEAKRASEVEAGNEIINKTRQAIDQFKDVIEQEIGRPNVDLAQLQKYGADLLGLDPEAMQMIVKDVAYDRGYDISTGAPIKVSDPTTQGAFADDNGNITDVTSLEDENNAMRVPEHVQNIVRGMYSENGSPIKTENSGKAINAMMSDTDINQAIIQAQNDGLTRFYVYKFDETKGDSIGLNNTKKKGQWTSQTFDPRTMMVSDHRVYDRRTGDEIGNLVQADKEGGITVIANGQLVTIPEWFNVNELKDAGANGNKFSDAWRFARKTTERVISHITGDIDLAQRESYRKFLRETLLDPGVKADNQIRTEKNGLYATAQEFNNRIRDAVGRERADNFKQDLSAYVENRMPLDREVVESLRQKNLEKMIADGEIQPGAELTKAQTRKLENLELEQMSNQELQDTAVREKYGDQALAIAKGWDQFRKAVYDNFFLRVNEELRRQGKPEIQYRENYQTHIEALEKAGFKDLIANAGGRVMGIMGDMQSDGRRGTLKSDIAGKTEYFKPTHRYMPFANRRFGNNLPVDPISALMNYSDVALEVIHRSSAIEKIRAFELALETKQALSKEDFTMPEHIKHGTQTAKDKWFKQRDNIRANAGGDAGALRSWTTELGNVMAGKTPILDRVAGADRQGGRWVNAANTLSNTVGRAFVLGNPGTVIKQTSSLINTLATAGPTNTIKGIMRSVNDKTGEYTKGIVKGLKANAKQNVDAIIDGRGASGLPDAVRTGKKPLWHESGMMRSLFETDLQADDSMKKVDQILGAPVGTMDKVMKSTQFYAQYERAISEGKSHNEAVKFAEVETNKLVHFRNKSNKAQIYNEKVLNSTILKFTAESAEQIKHFGDMTPKQKAGAVFMAFLYTAGLGAMGLNSGIPDPIGAGLDALEIAGDDDEDKSGVDKTKEIAQRGLSETLNAFPVLSNIINFLPKSERQKIFGKDSDLGKFDSSMTFLSPFSSAVNGLDSLGKYIGGGEERNSNDLVRGVGNIAQAFGTPASGQITKSIQGAMKASDEELGPIDSAKAVVFGKNAENNKSAVQRMVEGLGGSDESAKSTQTGIVKGISKKASKSDQEEAAQMKEKWGDDSLTYKSYIEAMDRKQRLGNSEDYKDSLGAINDSTAIKIAKGELVQSQEDGLLRDKNGKVATNLYRDIAKKLNEGVESAEDRTSNVYRDYIYSDEGKAHEYNEMKKDLENKLASGEMTFAAQIKAQKDLNKAEAMSTFNKYYRDGFSVVNNYNDTGKMYAMLESDEKRGEMQLQLNQINQKLLESGIITEKTYKSNYKSINQTGSSSGSGKGKGGSRGRGTFSAPNLPTSDYSSGAPKVSSGANKGKGIVKGIKVNSASADRGGVTVQDLPRARVKVSR